jgi:hypothetical protein
VRGATEIEEFLKRLFRPLARALTELCRPLRRLAFLCSPLRRLWSWLNEPPSPGEALDHSQQVYSLRTLFASHLIIVMFFSVVLGGMYLISEPAMIIINRLLPISKVYVPMKGYETDNPPPAKTNVPLWKNQFGQGFLGFVQLVPVSAQAETNVTSPVYALEEDNYDSTLPTSYSPIAGDGIGIYPAFSTTVLMEQLTPRLLTITPPPSPLPPPTDWKRLIQSKQQGICNIESPIIKPDTTLVAKFADSLGLTELYALAQLCINAYDGYDSIQIIEEKPQNKGVGEIIKRALLKGSCRSAKQRNGLGGYSYVPSVRYFTYTVTKGRIAGGAYITGDPNYLIIVLPQK